MRTYTISLPPGGADEATPPAAVGAPQPASLAPDDIEALISLRIILEDATLRAQDTSPAGRRIAAILLDGAAEAAIGIGLSAHNETPREKDSLERLHQRLTEALRNAGLLRHTERLEGWPAVRRLRRVRNDAQHHQIAPDHLSLVGWTQGVGRYVSQIVGLTHAVDIRSVTSASAILDEEIRKLMTHGEGALAKPDPREAIDLFAAAFARATAKWKQKQSSASSWPGRPSVFNDDLGIGKAISDQTAHLEQLLVVAPFAVDLGEYVWWRQVVRDIKDSRKEVSNADALRAQSWAFGWIVRWESFNQRYIERERIPAQSPTPPPASSQPFGCPEVDVKRECTVEFSRDGSGKARVPMRAGNGEEALDANTYLEYTNAFTNSLFGDYRHHVWLTADGWLEVSLPANELDKIKIDERFQKCHLEATAAFISKRQAWQDYETAIASKFKEVDGYAPEIATITDDTGDPICSRVEVAVEVAPSIALTGTIEAKFTNDFWRRLNSLYFHRSSARSTPEIGPGTLHGTGVSVPLDGGKELADLVRKVLEVVVSDEASVSIFVDNENANREQAAGTVQEALRRALQS